MGHPRTWTTVRDRAAETTSQLEKRHPARLLAHLLLLDVIS
jgi:hypothetical protein